MKIGCVEVWFNRGSEVPWYGDWSTDRSCGTGCVIVSLGWIGFTILKGACKNVEVR